MSEEVVETPVEATVETPVETPVETSVETSASGYQYIKEDGSFTDEFYTSLPDDLGSHSSIKQLKSVEDLAKSYINTKGLVGKKAEEFWTSEDADIVAKRKEIMGIPASAEGYEIQMPEMPEGSIYDEKMLNEFKGKAAELGITAEQAQKLVEWDAQRAGNAQELLETTIQAKTQSAEDALRKEWGTKFEYNVSKVTQATDFLGITDTVNEMGLGREPDFIKAIFEKVVPAISNDKLVESVKQDNLATISDSLTEIESKIYKYDGNTNTPEYKALVKARSDLLQKLN